MQRGLWEERGGGAGGTQDRFSGSSSLEKNNWAACNRESDPSKIIPTQQPCKVSECIAHKGTQTDSEPYTWHLVQIHMLIPTSLILGP